MDSGNDRILRYFPNSNQGVTIASAAFSTGRGMRLDSVGNIYVTDLNHRVTRFLCGMNTCIFALMISDHIIPPFQFTILRQQLLLQVL